MTASDICRELGGSPRTMGGMMRRLHNRGLIEPVKGSGIPRKNCTVWRRTRI